MRQALERAMSEGLGHPLQIQVFGDVAIGIHAWFVHVQQR
jgi:hypothetical protein